MSKTAASNQRLALFARSGREIAALAKRTNSEILRIYFLPADTLAVRGLRERETLTPRNWRRRKPESGNVVERKFLDGELWGRGVGSDLKID